MKKKELNKLTKAQAIKNIDKMKKDLFNLRFQKNQLKLEWEKVKAHRNFGHVESNQEEFYLR